MKLPEYGWLDVMRGVWILFTTVLTLLVLFLIFAVLYVFT